jgi:hypothetical protein
VVNVHSKAMTGLEFLDQGIRRINGYLKDFLALATHQVQMAMVISQVVSR